MTRFSEDGTANDERVAVLEFELRKAKETINALRNNLTVATGAYLFNFLIRLVVFHLSNCDQVYPEIKNVKIMLVKGAYGMEKCCFSLAKGVKIGTRHWEINVMYLFYLHKMLNAKIMSNLTGRQ